jgi:hypothetical protein
MLPLILMLPFIATLQLQKKKKKLSEQKIHPNHQDE